MVISLDGLWMCGDDGENGSLVSVPGMPCSPASALNGVLRYRREVELPDGSPRDGQIILTGARFCPEVYIDGRLVSRQSGGMTRTVHYTGKLPDKFTLEIRLKSLDSVPPDDASLIPETDRWRTNISSGLWDSVYLKLYNKYSINKIIPSVYAKEDKTEVFVDAAGGENLRVEAVITGNGTEVAHGECDAKNGKVTLRHGGKCALWSPDNPACYTLNVALYEGDSLCDEEKVTLGIRDFEISGKKFLLNGMPVSLRMGTYAYPRFCREPDACDIAGDPDWFLKNVLIPLKERGANAVRFHLGMPPESFLDICDAHGMLVQAEWSFFHGISASAESMEEQWGNWLGVCSRHPCVCVIHPWNEVDEEYTAKGSETIARLRERFPRFVYSHADVTHLHPYWWSLFENLGLYYDSAEQFDKPVISDEFGGNYLDHNWKYGLYPTVRDAFKRFLGRKSTVSERRAHHTESNARIAEYWRRTGVAGFSPFCIAGSREDGCSHYTGDLKSPQLKPVWDALCAAYSPVSVSIDIWDRNFISGEKAYFVLHMFNDTPDERLLNIVCGVENGDSYVLTRALPPFSKSSETLGVTIEGGVKTRLIYAELLDPPENVKRRVISSWRVRTFERERDLLSGITVGVYACDDELRRFVERNGGKTAAPSQKCDVVVLGAKGIEKGCVSENVPLLICDADRAFDMRGCRATFEKAREGESCVHPAGDGELWRGMRGAHTRIWNGLRGGLIIPAADMKITAPPDCEVKYLVEAGRSMAKHPVVFVPGKRIIFSQLLTESRLAPVSQQETGYFPRYDPAAERITVNMILKLINNK